MNAQINFDTLSLCRLAYDLRNHEMGSQVDNSIFISQSVSDIRCSGQYWNSDLRHHRRKLEGIVFFFSLEFDEYFQMYALLQKSLRIFMRTVLNSGLSTRLFSLSTLI